MYVIYALVDPRDQKVRYVGMTDNVYKRFVSHIQGSGNNYEKNAWIHEARRAHVMIQMQELERTEDRGYARAREMYWIHHYRMLQHPITNIAHGQIKFVKSVLIRSPRKTQKAAAKVEKAPAPLTSEKGKRESLYEADILAAINKLKEEACPLTIRAIAKRAKLTWHQFDDIEEIAAYYGYDIERGKGRPARTEREG